MPRDAAYFRAHRQAFELALELGCTPKEAATRIKLIEMRERHRALAQQHAARINPPRRGAAITVGSAVASDDDGRDGQPWMMRE